jgi:hypothetical protein
MVRRVKAAITRPTGFDRADAVSIRIRIERAYWTTIEATA